jgi:23S rRNA pseudouridine1911/1915/1917 synthase
MNKENLMYVSKDRKNAQFCITHYRVLKQTETHTLLDVNIDSGRKNQIRVQLGSIGHNVIGDDKYGEPSDPINRLGLHAYSLTFKYWLNSLLLLFEIAT